MEDSWSAKVACAVERPVAAAPEAVFERLLRADRYGDWWPRHMRFAAGHDGALAVGSRLDLTAFGCRSTLEVVKVRPAKVLALRFVGGAYQGTAEWMLEPSPDHPGSTRAIFQMRAEPVSPWLSFLARFFDLGRFHGLWAEQALERLEARLNP